MKIDPRIEALLKLADEIKELPQLLAGTYTMKIHEASGPIRELLERCESLEKENKAMKEELFGDIEI